MHGATKMFRGSASLVLALAGGLAACGGADGPQSDDGAVASPDGAPADLAAGEPDGRSSPGIATETAVEDSDGTVVDGAGAKGDVVIADGGIVRPDGQDAARRPLVPCSADPSVLLWEWDTGYVCGSCDNDVSDPLVCRDGFLACPISYVTASGNVVTVPPSAYVLDKSRSQCAAVPYVAPTYALLDPNGLTTARDPALPLRLRELPDSGSLLAFGVMFANRARGEAALRSLVTLTDMTKGAPVAYEIGEPVRDTAGVATLSLTPALPLAANAWYRVTVYPGETQHLVACRTIGKTSKLLTGPETTDFYTGSRPMVADMFIPDKGGGKGYFQFDFTEPLSAADLAAYPMAVVAVDGAELSGCLIPYACAGGVSAGLGSLRLDVTVLPVSFTTVTLRIPHAIHSTGGGTILDGTAGNPHATVDGDFAVYTFNAADMVLTDNNSVKRWLYAGP